MKLVISIAMMLIMFAVGAGCQAAGPTSPQSRQLTDSCDEASRAAAERHVRELFGFWKTLYPEFINGALTKMTASNMTYQGKLTEAEDGVDGMFYATVQLRDTARPDYPSLNAYCYDAANEATSKMDALRSERAYAKTRVELANKMIDIGNMLNDTTPHAAKTKITYVPGKALLIVFYDAPVRLDEQVGSFSKDFKCYLTTVLTMDVTKVLDEEEKSQAEK